MTRTASVRLLAAAALAAGTAFAATAASAPAAPRGCGALVERADLFGRLWSGYQTKTRIRWAYYSHPNAATARAAFHRYYAGQARRLVEGHLRRGSGPSDGDNPKVSIRSIRVSANERCARLWTTETWLVTRGGEPVYTVRDGRFTIWQEKRETRWVVVVVQAGWRR